MHTSGQMVFQPAECWPVLGCYDVVVVGAGPAGIAAAIAAARGGARTVLVDKASSPGGVASNAHVPHIMGLADRGRQIVAGVADEFVRTLDAMGEARLRQGDRCDEAPIGARALLDNVITNDHAIRVAANRLLTAAGVDLLYYTPLVGVVAAQGRVEAVAVDCLEGPRLIRGRVFVDCTGDATLVHRGGGRTVLAAADEAMTKTMIFDLTHVKDFRRAAATARFKQLLAEGKVPVAVQDHFMGFACMESGVVHLNFTAVTGDALDSRDMTRMDVELREQITAAVAWFRREFAGFEHSWLSRTAEVVGVRASRVGVGLETITQQDIDEDAPVPQPVAVGIRRYGDHGTRGFAAEWRKPVSGVRPIPWRALLSADLANVAMAGRCMSVEPRMLTCVRYIGQCMATGQAAGTTAALAVQGGGILAEVAYRDLRKALEDSGAIVD